MNSLNIKTTIDNIIKDDIPLTLVIEIINDLKKSGVEKEELLNILESMRDKSSEAYEDRLLEIMDIVVGFCTLKTDYENK